MTFTAQPSVILGVAAALTADATVSAMLAAGPGAGAVYDFELPVAEDNAMPTQCVIVKPHAGPTGPSTLELNYSRVIIQCYGPTMNLANQLDFATYMVLKQLQSSVWSHTYIHNCIRTAGPTPGRDPVLQWPYNTSMWLVKASDLSV